MRYLLFVLAFGVLRAEIVKMEDGQCYEQHGKMHYVTPCPKEKRSDQKQQSAQSEEDNACRYSLGEYQIKQVSSSASQEGQSGCDRLLEHIKSMHLVYETSLITDKEKIATMQVRFKESLCKVELYSGDFIYVGLMSGDQLVCNGFMEYHSQLAK